MSNQNSRRLTYLLGAVIVGAVIGETIVLYAVVDPVLRVRLGLLIMGIMGWPLVLALRGVVTRRSVVPTA